MQNSHPAAQAHTNDELSLHELWQALVKRKWLIVLCVLMFMAVGATYIHFKAPIYGASVSLRIGQIQNERTAALLLESPAELIARLAALHGGSVKASLQHGTTNIIGITTMSSEADEAASMLKSVAKSVIDSHTDAYNGNIKSSSERLRQIDEKRQSLERELIEVGQLVARIRAKEPVQASLMVMQRSFITDSLNQLDAERLRLSQQLSPPQTRPTELLGEIVVPAKPSKPKKALALALAAMLGLMGGVMLALVMEFGAKAHKRQA